jgi:hypothetical protein
MRKFFIYAAAFLIPFIIISASTKDESRQKKVQAVKLTGKIDLDGILSEPVWKSNPTDNFIQQEPDEGSPASEETYVWVAYDDTHIYFAGNMLDSAPNEIDQSLMRRDNMVKSDWFFIYIDPYFDRRTGYYFAVNPGGSILDGTIYNDSRLDDKWDGIWEVQTHVNSEGWSFEMRIPFSQMRFNETEDMKWGVNFNRDIMRKNEMDFYVMVPKSESGFVSHFATLEGLKGIKPKQRLEFLPYIVQKAQYLQHETDDPFYSANQYETSFGLDFKVGLGSNLTIDGTINPDFGQVEVDPAVVNLSAFETFYQEKRPFFIEGENIFRYGYGGVNNNWSFNFSVPDLFYSRRIGRTPQGVVPDYDYLDYPNETRIIGAAKLTGKMSESVSIGGLSAITERTYSSLSTDGNITEEQVEPLSHYGVLRTSKEYDEGRHGLGMIFTSTNRDLRNSQLYNQLVSQAYTAGMDGWTTLDADETYVVNGSLVGSYIYGSEAAVEEKQLMPYRYFQRPDRTRNKLDPTLTSLSGWYSRIMLNKQKGNFYINTAIGAVSPGFENNDLGFQYNADKINGHLVLGYQWFQPDNIFRQKRLYLAHFKSYDFEGNNIGNGFFLFSFMEFLNFYRARIMAGYDLEKYDNTLTRGGPIVLDPSGYFFRIFLSSDGSKEFILGTNIDYRSDSMGSYRAGLGFDITWKPSTQIYFSFGPAYQKNFDMLQWIDNFEDPVAVNTYEHRYVFGEIDQETFSANIRLNWTFTPQLSLQLFLQPLFSLGNYTTFKELAGPRTYDYNFYGEGGSTIDYDSENSEYTVDPDGDGPAEPFTFSNPDFNYKSLRGNLVLRYEMLPGSVFYFVWTHDKLNDENAGDFNLDRDFNNLINAEANNILMLKFSYWLDI